MFWICWLGNVTLVLRFIKIVAGYKREWYCVNQLNHSNRLSAFTKFPNHVLSTARDLHIGSQLIRDETLPLSLPLPYQSVLDCETFWPQFHRLLWCFCLEFRSWHKGIKCQFPQQSIWHESSLNCVAAVHHFTTFSWHREDFFHLWLCSVIKSKNHLLFFKL